jgi:hypothetical protein
MDSPDQPAEAIINTDIENPTLLEHRTKVFADEANQVFSRHLSDVALLNSRTITLLQIFLILVSIESSVIVFLIQKGYKFSTINFIFLIPVLILASTSFIVLLWRTIPRQFGDVKLFEDSEFYKLINLQAQDVLSDYIYWMKKSYDHNVEIYKSMAVWYYRAHFLIIAMIIFYILFIISIFVFSSFPNQSTCQAICINQT